MSDHDFISWLQGFLDGNTSNVLDQEQLDVLRSKLREHVRGSKGSDVTPEDLYHLVKKYQDARNPEPVVPAPYVPSWTPFPSGNDYWLKPGPIMCDINTGNGKTITVPVGPAFGSTS